MKVFHVVALILVTFTLVTATAQDGMPTSKLSLLQAANIAENAMQGFNNADYAVWVNNWSDKMKAAIKERDFKVALEQLRGLGKFRYFTKAELVKAKTPGFVRWQFDGVFEKGAYRFVFTFAQDGDKVEGVLTEAIK